MSMINHERCSELLSRYLDRNLDAHDLSAVEEHLSSCERCRAEHDALQALQAPEPAALTADERAGLERGVMAGLGGRAPDHVVTPLPTRSFGARVAPVLGAAAAVAAIATFVYFGVASNDTDEPAATREAGMDASEPFGGGGRVRDRQGHSDKGTLRTTADRADDTEAASGTTFKEAPPAPSFTVATDAYTSAELEKLGASGVPTIAAAQYYTADKTDARSSLLDQLVSAAEQEAGVEVADQVADCAGRVLETNDPIVPTFGAAAKLDRREVVIIGFAWARNSPGPLDRFMVWAWERGDCDVAVEYVEGRIETSQ